jgi:FlaG/FlaF family flagellin (archaellin)
VSPVVATVLMVALVVVLAGTSLFLFAEPVNEATQSPPPTAGFSWVQNGNSVTVTHVAGDSVSADQLSIAIDGTQTPWPDVGSSGTVGAGDVAQFTVTGTKDVSIVWQAADGERSTALATRTIDAPATASFSGTNAGIKSTSEDGGYLGFGNMRLDDAGFSPEGHVRIAPYKTPGSELQVRDTSDDKLATTGYSPAPGTHSFSLVYDGTTLTLTAGGKTVQTTAVSVEEDAIAIQVKRADADVTTAEVSTLKLDGASIGTPDAITVTANDEKSLLLEGGGVTDGFTLTGEFTFDDSGAVGGEGFVVRVDVA